MGPRGPVLGNPHPPLFLPHGLEPESGSPLPSRLQPILLLDPSVSHAPLLTGESCCFSRGGAGSLHPAKDQTWDGSHPSCPLCHPPILLCISLLSPCPPPRVLASFHSFPWFPPYDPRNPLLSSARAWAPALSLCPVLTDHRAALRVRPPPAAEPDPLRAPAPKHHHPPAAGPPAAPPGAAQTSCPADQGEGKWVGEVVRGCLTGPLGAERGREALEGQGPGGPERGCGSWGAKRCMATGFPARCVPT